MWVTSGNVASKLKADSRHWIFFFFLKKELGFPWENWVTGVYSKQTICEWKCCEDVSGVVEI